MTTGEQATSVMRFLESMSGKYREFLCETDDPDKPRRAGRPSHDDSKRIAKETDEAVKLIQRGMSIAAAARQIKLDQSTLSQRLRKRGLTLRVIRNGGAK